MCDYCEGEKWTYESSELNIGVCGYGKLAIYTMGGDGYIDIKYCPHCGRSLRDNN